MKFKNIFPLLLALLISTVALAENINSTSLNKNQVSDLLKDKTITVGPCAYINSDKLIANTVQVYYSPDGMLKGKWLTPLKNGPQTDEGTWAISEDGSLCNTWNHWGQFCTYIFPVKEQYLFISTDQNKILSIAKNKIVYGNKINKNGKVANSQ